MSRIGEVCDNGMLNILLIYSSIESSVGGTVFLTWPNEGKL